MCMSVCKKACNKTTNQQNNKKGGSLYDFTIDDHSLISESSLYWFRPIHRIYKVRNILTSHLSLSNMSEYHSFVFSRLALSKLYTSLFIFNTSFI